METSVPDWPNAVGALIRAPALTMNADNKRLLLIILISPDSGILILARWAADSASFPATVLLVIDYL
jgi:hypothetical protein